MTKPRKRRVESRELLDELKAHLVARNYRPGDLIETEIQLARQFNVSRARIREATTTLGQLGVLESRTRRGTVVKTFDPVATGEHLGFHFTVGGLNPADSREARTVIELAILPLVVRRITPIQIEQLRETIRRMESASRADQVYQADRDFHLILLRACGNQTLQAFSEVILGIFAQQERTPDLDPQVRERSVAEHKELARLIEDSDVQGALAVLTQHLKRRAED